MIVFDYTVKEINNIDISDYNVEAFNEVMIAEQGFFDEELGQIVYPATDIFRDHLSRVEYAETMGMI